MNVRDYNNTSSSLSNFSHFQLLPKCVCVCYSSSLVLRTVSERSHVAPIIVSERSPAAPVQSICVHCTTVLTPITRCDMDSHAYSFQ
ncbi:hypothetical protein QL285_062544 [Trifolium repens]|nr:hypothetical protein QL285_062544 [Trifolium repens]